MLPADELAEIRQQQKLLDVRSQELRTQILTNREARIGNLYSVSIKVQITKRTDWKELATFLGATPEHIEAFSYQSSSEVVRIKSSLEYKPEKESSTTFIEKLGRSNPGQSFCALDVETTGLFPKNGDRIIQIALCKFRLDPFDQIIEVEEFSTYLNPEERKSHPDAQAKHGIKAEALRSAPKFRDVKDQIYCLLKDSIIIGHNCHFDMAFIQHELHRAGCPLLQNELVDTLSIARELWPDVRSTLGTLAEHFGIDLDTSLLHDALADAQTLQMLVPFILKRIRSIENATSLAFNESDDTK